MKKVGIVTLFGEFNFGNRLQNYAVQEVLKSKGFEVETIKYTGLNAVVASTDSEQSINRLEKFKKFNENIKFANQIIYKENEVPKDFSDSYDYIVIGSDQIWNFNFDKVFSDKVFGSFVPIHKRISFSASFGVNFLPTKGSQEYDICQKYLKEIKLISVRETAGKEIVEGLTGREDVEVLLDPTMMLDIKKWEVVMKKPENLKSDRFIVKSFLGNASNIVYEELTRIAKENNCEIIDISAPNSPFYNVGPAEFLYLEKNAFLVATDSFHSCVFAILFSTPFVVFERDDARFKSMHSRIETLLEKFEMTDRIFQNKILNSILSNDYTKAHIILQKERQKVNKFLDKALECSE